jgi:hypothetical protein
MAVDHQAGGITNFRSDGYGRCNASVQIWPGLGQCHGRQQAVERGNFEGVEACLLPRFCACGEPMRGPVYGAAVDVGAGAYRIPLRAAKHGGQRDAFGLPPEIHRRRNQSRRERRFRLGGKGKSTFQLVNLHWARGDDPVIALGHINNGAIGVDRGFTNANMTGVICCIQKHPCGLRRDLNAEDLEINDADS